MIVFRVFGGEEFGKGQEYNISEEVHNVFATTNPSIVYNLCMHELSQGSDECKIAVIDSENVRPPKEHEKIGETPYLDEDEVIVEKGTVIDILYADFYNLGWIVEDCRLKQENMN